MPASGKKFVKPGFLAQKTRYENEREKQIEKNKEIMKSLGLKDLPRYFSKTASESANGKMQYVDGDDDCEYVPIEGDDGLSSDESNDNTETAPTRGIKRKATLCPLEENSREETIPSPSTLISTTQDSQAPLTIAPDTVAAKTKKGRGKTSGKWLQQFQKHNGNTKISVPVHEQLNGLCGDNASKAAHILGMHIRQRCPIRARHWQDVDPGTQDVIIQAVLDHFNISDNFYNNTQAQQIIHTKCYLIHKNWWYKMKCHYREVKNQGDDVDVYSKPYHGVTPDDWRYMIDEVWKSDKHVKRSEAGTLNRSLLPYNHTSGSRSFVAAMTSKDAPIGEDGELDFPELFKKTHKNKKDQWIDPLCEEKHAQMLTMQDESTQSGVKLTPEDISREVLGVGKKTRYLRGFGVGPKISQSSSRSSARDKEMEKLRDDLEKQNKEREREREEQERKFEEQERKIEEQQKKFEMQQIQFEEQQKRMEDLQSLVGQLLQDRNGQFI